MPLSRAARQNLAQKIISKLAHINPNPRCELFYKSEFQLLVSVVLSAQATDKIVNRCMQPLYEAGLTPQTLVDWGYDKTLKQIRTIGLAPTKAKRIIALAEIVLQKYKGHIPRTREELEALPGVGRKTANVILGELFGEPTLAVDTHVFRTTQRLGLQNEKTPEKAELELLKVIDPKELPRAHHLFILHGRYTCKAQKPLCDQCPVLKLCPFNSKNLRK